MSQVFASHQPTVYLLDDDPSVVVALGRLLKANGFTVCAATSAAELLAQHDPESPGCLVTDLRMPEVNGLELQRALAARGMERSVVFISGQGDVRSTAEAMRAGAVTFLAKPVQSAELIAAVREAITKDAVARALNRDRQEVSQRIARLTPRERQVLKLVVAGKLNKEIAGELGTSEKTVKIHRARALRKMGVGSATALVDLLYRTEMHATLLSAPAPSPGEGPV
jgi:RNA polymerase sigma factor (sigma-70 family)